MFWYARNVECSFSLSLPHSPSAFLSLTLSHALCCARYLKSLFACCSIVLKISYFCAEFHFFHSLSLSVYFFVRSQNVNWILPIFINVTNFLFIFFPLFFSLYFSFTLVADCSLHLVGDSLHSGYLIKWKVVAHTWSHIEHKRRKRAQIEWVVFYRCITMKTMKISAVAVAAAAVAAAMTKRWLLEA